MPSTRRLLGCPLHRGALVATGLLAALLAGAGCSENPTAPEFGDPREWRVVPETTLALPAPSVRLAHPRWSPDGRFLAMDGTGGVYLSDYPPTRPPTLISGERIHDFRWNPDGRLLALDLLDGPRVAIYDIGLHLIKTRIQQPDVRILANLMWTQAGHLAACAPEKDEDDRAYLYDENGRPLPLSRLGGQGYAWQRSGFRQEAEIWSMAIGAADARRVFGPGQYMALVCQSPASGLFAFYTDLAVPDFVVTAVSDYSGQLRHVFDPSFYASDWTTDGRYLLGEEVDFEDSEGIAGAELAVFDAVTSAYVVITDTPDMLELNPSLCLANDRIAYDDDEGHIVIARVERVVGDR